MTSFDGILKDLKAFEESPQNPGFDFRLDLADIICRQLREKGWSQAKLAEATGRSQSYITRIVHSSSNCTFDTAGRILFALGVKAKIVEVQPAAQKKQHASTTIVSSTTASSGILKISESNG